jgi:hypothetical protein
MIFISRNQLTLFFSKTSAEALEPFVVSETNRLCVRLEQAALAGDVIVLAYAFVALILDVIHTSFMDSRFCRDWYENIVVTRITAPLVHQFPSVLMLLRWFTQLASAETIESKTAVEKHRSDHVESITTVLELHKKGEASQERRKTLFRSMLRSRCSP